MRYRLGSFLSRIIACFKRQRPSITSTISYTIRFSKPEDHIQVAETDIAVNADNLRSGARATARFATAVVLPTPPFPDVMVITFAGITFPNKK
jgi:hypothetical protein